MSTRTCFHIKTLRSHVAPLWHPSVQTRVLVFRARSGDAWIWTYSVQSLLATRLALYCVLCPTFTKLLLSRNNRIQRDNGRARKSCRLLACPLCTFFCADGEVGRGQGGGDVRGHQVKLELACRIAKLGGLIGMAVSGSFT